MYYESFTDLCMVVFLICNETRLAKRYKDWMREISKPRLIDMCIWFLV